MSSSPQYTGYFSPVYKVQLVEEAPTPINPRATRPIDLTGVSTSDGFTLIMQRPGTEDFQHGIGTWEIIDAENGEAAYQWTAGDLAVAGRFFVYVTVQLPDEPSPRAFDHDIIRVVLLEKGGAAVATQDVNVLQINGEEVSSAHPLPITGPVQIADGGDVTQGAKDDDPIVDPTLDATEIALLKGLVKILAEQTLAVDLATAIAGEDIVNDRLKTSNETVMSNTNTHNATSILNGSVGTTNNAVFSSPINCANYRRYAIAGWGANGNIQLLLQISYDGGTTWLWHPNGFVNAGQFITQVGDIIAPLCRIAATNVSGSTQNVTAYLCLVR
jgi:hypothetical protein